VVGVGFWAEVTPVANTNTAMLKAARRFLVKKDRIRIGRGLEFIENQSVFMRSLIQKNVAYVETEVPVQR
jgi:hypothetical protein